MLKFVMSSHWIFSSSIWNLIAKSYSYKILWLLESLMVYDQLIPHKGAIAFCASNKLRTLCLGELLEEEDCCVFISLIFASISPSLATFPASDQCILFHILFQRSLPLCTLEMEPDCLCIIAPGCHCFNFESEGIEYDICKT